MYKTQQSQKCSRNTHERAYVVLTCSLPTYIRWMKEQDYLICELDLCLLAKPFMYQSSPAMSPSACALLCLATASPSPNRPRSVPAIPADREKRGVILHPQRLKLCTVKGASSHQPTLVTTSLVPRLSSSLVGARRDPGNEARLLPYYSLTKEHEQTFLLSCYCSKYLPCKTCIHQQLNKELMCSNSSLVPRPRPASDGKLGGA